MTREVDLQKSLVDAFNASDGHAFKATNQFLVGVLDLSVKLAGVEHAYIETKVVKCPLKSATVQLELTEKQRAFMRRHQRAGGLAAYCVFMKTKNRWHVHLGSDAALDKLPVISFSMLPRWVEPQAITAMFEAFLMGLMNDRAARTQSSRS